jgi:hypothetical protein
MSTITIQIYNSTLCRNNISKVFQSETNEPFEGRLGWNVPWMNHLKAAWLECALDGPLQNVCFLC